MQAIGRMLVSLGSGLMLLMWIGAAALHLYTILVAYQVYGFVAAFLALVAPAISEIALFILLWIKTENFLNGYNFYVIVYLLWLAFGLVCVALGTYLSEHGEATTRP